MSSRYSSTTASGHQGTGVGRHDRNWPHYNPPSTKDLDRKVFTCFDYVDADTKISLASQSSGSLTVNAEVYDAAPIWKCSNCNQSIVGGSLPGRNGCKTRVGDHNWTCRQMWVKRAKATTGTLHYDKAGRSTLVSMHR